MKAAVLHQFGTLPHYEDFPDPVPGTNEQLIHVKAVALENIDKGLANGSHYSTQQFLPQLPAVLGLDGLGALEDGTLVGFGGMKPPYGSLAEKAVITKGYYAPIPAGIDPVVAAALPASALTALFPLKWGAKFQPGETLFINGITSTTGHLALQVAKHLGAGRVVGTGRHAETLETLKASGADSVINLTQPEEQLTQALAAEAEKGIDVILDCLWGHPTELLLKALTPHELGFAKRRTRLIQVGEMAGATISLPGEALRTSGLEIMGAGAGLTPEAMGEATQMVWDWLREGKLHLDIVQVPLSDIESAWQRTDLHGKRIVIVP
jgi:NADPH:quinone reductase-like Zn-dependent oxidoreductase